MPHGVVTEGRDGIGIDDENGTADSSCENDAGQSPRDSDDSEDTHWRSCDDDASTHSADRGVKWR